MLQQDYYSKSIDEIKNSLNEELDNIDFINVINERTIQEDKMDYIIRTINEIKKNQNQRDFIEVLIGDRTKYELRKEINDLNNNNTFNDKLISFLRR